MKLKYIKATMQKRKGQNIDERRVIIRVKYLNINIENDRINELKELLKNTKNEQEDFRKNEKEKKE